VRNYWVELPRFMECVDVAWARSLFKTYNSTIIADKLKGLRHELK
jgi:hypothetical protein